MNTSYCDRKARHRVSVLNVVHGEPICDGFMREPGFGPHRQTACESRLLGDGNNLELRQPTAERKAKPAIHPKDRITKTRKGMWRTQRLRRNRNSRKPSFLKAHSRAASWENVRTRAVEANTPCATRLTVRYLLSIEVSHEMSIPGGHRGSFSLFPQLRRMDRMRNRGCNRPGLVASPTGPAEQWPYQSQGYCVQSRNRENLRGRFSARCGSNLHGCKQASAPSEGWIRAGSIAVNAVEWQGLCSQRRGWYADSS